jgi:hypothetical protein
MAGLGLPFDVAIPGPIQSRTTKRQPLRTVALNTVFSERCAEKKLGCGHCALAHCTAAAAAMQGNVIMRLPADRRRECCQGAEILLLPMLLALETEGGVCSWVLRVEPCLPPARPKLLPTTKWRLGLLPPKP